MKKSKMKKRSECLFLIANIILSIVAIGFIVGLQIEVVNANPYGKITNTQTGASASTAGVESSVVMPAPDNSNLGAEAGVTEKTGNLAKIKGYFTGQAGGITQGLAQGVLWAGTAYMATSMLGKLFGVEDEPWFDAAQKSLSIGLFAGKTIQGGIAQFGAEGTGIFGKAGFFGTSPMIAGIGIGIIIFVLTYKKVEYKTVTFHCNPWEAPVGGNDCEKCNDALHVCTEYRCKSLGQACELENVGTENEICVWKNRNDVKSPAIRVLKEVLTEGYRYTNLQGRPPERGTQIVKTNGGCIAPFTPIEFGIETDKPAQCKISFNPDEKYDDIEYDFGESSLYAYNHTQKMNLPSPDAINDFAKANESETGGLEIQNDGVYDLYVRCRSVNGYYNRDPYLIHFCVDKGPDTTAPIIEEFSIADGSPVQYEIDKVPIVVYTNEPAECKWSKTDQVFDNMENKMNCVKSLLEQSSNTFYACSGDLTGVEDRKTNIYYFKCKDQPWMSEDKRNTMSQSKTLTLIGTQPLNINIDSVKPKDGETITGATSVVEVNLELETQNGYKDGEAECYYCPEELTGDCTDASDFSAFAETNSFKHKQRQDLPTGTYTYNLKCIDLGGNSASVETTFNVYVDTQPPAVVRILYNADALEIITDEDGECYYSLDNGVGCNYEIGENTLSTIMIHTATDRKNEHYAEWYINKNYYIKCMDMNGKQPLPTQCSVIVKPVEIAG